MIPDVVTRRHLEHAAKALPTEDIPKRHRSTRYDVVVDGALYPPKYLVALAIKEATGGSLTTRGFGGGRETNGFLRRHGFTVVDKKGVCS